MTDLNERVAVEVFGARPTTYPGFNHCNGTWWWMPGMHESEATCELPDYQGSIADAWLVVEKMREDGFVVWIDNSEIADGNWEVHFQMFTDSGPTEALVVYGSAITDTAPEAICRAALVAMRSES